MLCIVIYTYIYLTDIYEYISHVFYVDRLNVFNIYYILI